MRNEKVLNVLDEIRTIFETIKQRKMLGHFQLRDHILNGMESMIQG